MTASLSMGRPQPPISRDTAAFWEGIREGVFRLQNCASCHHVQYPPEPNCARCGELEFTDIEASGRGHLVSFAVVHHPPASGFEYPLPIAVVALDEGPRVVLGLERSGEAPRIGAAVELCWPEADPSAALSDLVPTVRILADAPQAEQSPPTPTGALQAVPGSVAATQPRTPRSAIVGVGFTEFSSNSGRSEIRLAIEACRAAMSDAGISGADVDGLVSFTMDTNPENDLARALGIPALRHFSRVGFGGGGACGAVALADQAIASGAARTVVIYRAFNERSGNRFGAGVQDRPIEPTAERVQFAWTSPHGLLTPASWMAVIAREMMHVHGVTSEDFGRVSVGARAHAATNPRAQFYGRPVTLDDHQDSRMIVEPLHLLDCCLETDGGVALVLTDVHRASDLPSTPVIVTGAVQGAASTYHMSRAVLNPQGWRAYDAELCAQQLWASTGLRPADVDAAMLYDAFTPQVLAQLESFGFCAAGEAKDFVRSGEIGLTGQLPVNTHGGQLGEGYLHGMNGLVEAVLQLRGTAANQLRDPRRILVSSSPFVPSSAAIFSLE